MSSVIRSLAKSKANKKRKGLTSRGRKPGAAKSVRLVPQPRRFDVGDKFDLSRANPSCRTCHGSGVVGTVVSGKDRKTYVCPCVERGMTGDAPWIPDYVRTIDRAATRLAAAEITKDECEEICKAAWIKEKGPVPDGRMLCVELRGKALVVGHQAIPEGATND